MRGDKVQPCLVSVLHPLGDGDQPHPFPSLGSLGVGGGAVWVGEWVYAKQDLGPLTPGRGMRAGAPLPASTGGGGKAAAHRGSRLRFLELKANCVSSCQPQEERHKHHLSAGACRGRLLRASSEGLKWKWPRLPGPVSAWDEMLPGWVGCGWVGVPGRSGAGVGRAEVEWG